MIRIVSLLLLTTQFTQAQTPCVDGVAGSFPCNQMTFHARMSPQDLDGHYLNDIWGWTDPESGKEYALVGLSEGVSFVDVSTPSSPVLVGKLGETHQHGRGVHGESAWRDIKVYQDHAFIVSDLNSFHGMQVFDLTKLRDYEGTFISFDHDAVYEGIGSAHNIAINEETGYAYIVGTSSGGGSCAGGGLHILNIQDPKNPVYEACFDDDGYTHDAQCVIYAGPDSDYAGREICFNSNEDTFTIVDVNDKSSSFMVSRNFYQQYDYTHQGWLTEDHQYFLMNDELDEREYSFDNPRTLIWDVRDLDDPVLIGEYFNEAVSIDHNLYTHQGLVFESNYASGLRVLDGQRIEDGQLREVAFLDTEPAYDELSFNGAWSSYPYFESGNIIISDINRGLFIVSLDWEETITSHPAVTEESSSSTHTFTVEASRTDLEVQWQINEGYTFADLEDDDNFGGADTNELTVQILANQFAGDLVRAKLTAPDGSTFLSFSAPVPTYMQPTGALDISELKVYPNPAGDYLKISLMNITEAQLTDLSGRIIKTGWINENTPLDISDIMSGTYLLTLEVDGSRLTKRIQKR